MTARLTLVSHPLCPYVQRAAISLAEKAVPFVRVSIDLADKPDWFKSISPLGKVPLLRVRNGNAEDVIFESSVILEFLEETEADPLHPTDPLARARHRAWIEFGSAILNAIGRFYSAGDEAAFLHESKALSEMFARVEAELAARQSGPWFAGDSFSLVDLTPPIKNGKFEASTFYYQIGGGSKIQLVRAYYEWPLFTPFLKPGLSTLANGDAMLVATDVFRNEPF